MWKDPIVEEVRRVRREIELEARNDFGRILAKAYETQEQYADKLVSRPSTPVDTKVRPTLKRR